ncbi:homoserine kinase [Halomonas denitrificans]|uniref:homoserine kinase n=1 Tax=Halomonas TaxID=2745 RepID=UPI001A8F50C6|nr:MULTISPECIES: homoserine kinase [Halomonas]MED5296416.1 homoserine kinase [Pseudomonadota bacterium]MBN8412023.1 homoserine kinase [Halomonas litopenaei]MBY5926332.1 homoserine kinase [Halomonas sp. DP4Y7-2]MBY5929999.1 homoserine kinase [Halomonas sp. DP8Y7-3]MBY5969962.1 homoserine kinase [Halomonas denitrificans]
MAVFTPLEDSQVSGFLSRFDVGELTRLQGVPAGTENSTFFVTTDRRELVLTLFEQGEHEELPFFVELLDFLDEHRIPVAGPIHDRDGVALHELAGRPALLFPRLPGSHPKAPNTAQCRALGQALGEMHRVSRHFSGHRPNPRDIHWLSAMHHKVLVYLSPADQALMQDEVDAYQAALETLEQPLPQGALHGDLFRDNTLFDGEQLGGIIDFYNGCTGDLLFDLAIVINDWATDGDGHLDQQRHDALLEAYLAERPLTAQERALWPLMLRLTALRYWLSRLLVVYVDPPAHDLTPHDPEQFRRILRSRLEHGALPLPDTEVRL